MSNLAEAQIYAKKRSGKALIQTGPTTFLVITNMSVINHTDELY